MKAIDGNSKVYRRRTIVSKDLYIYDNKGSLLNKFNMRLLVSNMGLRNRFPNVKKMISF